MNNTNIHSNSQLIALHLFPGIVGTIAYVILAPVLIQNGYPAILGLLIAATVVILPIELCTLLYLARKTNGTFTLKEIIPYRDPLPKWQYVIIPLGLVIWGFLATFFTSMIDAATAKAWFSWLPEWFFSLT